MYNAYVLFTCRCVKKCNPKHIAVEQGVSTELITRRQLLGRRKPPSRLWQELCRYFIP